MLRGAGFTVETDVAEVPAAIADPAAVSNCLENLVSNAMKYSGTNRWLGVRLRTVSVPSPEIQIQVEDKGPGIPSADLPYIFEPFYRVRAVRRGENRGVGLGLYLVKQTMENMGGSVSVSNHPGYGALFVLHFPVKNLSPRSEEQPQRADAPARFAPR
jgi:signal transduction histidine kinase